MLGSRLGHEGRLTLLRMIRPYDRVGRVHIVHYRVLMLMLERSDETHSFWS